MHRILFVVTVCCVLMLSETMFGTGSKGFTSFSEGRCDPATECTFGQRANDPGLRANLPAKYRGLVRRCELALGDGTRAGVGRCVDRHIAAHRAVQRYPARLAQDVAMCRGRLSGYGPKHVEACVIKWSGERAYAFTPSSHGLPRPTVL